MPFRSSSLPVLPSRSHGLLPPSGSDIRIPFARTLWIFCIESYPHKYLESTFAQLLSFLVSLVKFNV